MTKFKQRGYTVVELLIALATSTIIITVLSTLTTTMYRQVQISKTTSELNNEAMVILHAVVDDTRLAGSLLKNNSIQDNFSPTGGWVTNDPSNVLIISYPATDTSANVIYDQTSGLPYKNEIVYFGINKQLYRRTLKNENAPNNNFYSTCPDGSSNCKRDREYTTNLKDLSFTFYDENDTSTSDATLARSVNITVTLEKKVYGKSISVSNSLRTTLRNR